MKNVIESSGNETGNGKEDTPVPETYKKEDSLYVLNKEVMDPEKLEGKYEIAVSVHKLRSPENIGPEILRMLRYSIDQQDKGMLRFALEELQRKVNEGYPDKNPSPIEDYEIDGLLKEGGGEPIVIYCGGGTHGERVSVSRDGLFMKYDREYGSTFDQNFRKMYDLPDDEEDMKISF